MKKINKKGFTLIELLAVIIILGILMIIAIPSVTTYISNSRKSAYIDTAKEIIGGARNLVNEGKLGMYDTNTTYYLPTQCIKTENGSSSPYGEFTKAYVGVVYSGSGYKYYWISNDTAGQGIKKVTSLDKLSTDDIESNVKDEDIEDSITTSGVGNRSDIGILNCDGTWQSTIHLSDLSNNISEDGNGSLSGNQKIICKRATVLNTETCNSSGCRNAGIATGTTITYGSLGTSGQLSPGDAFDCDLTGDGTYNERFYYISDYFDTYSLSFDSSTAVLIYNKDVYNGVPSQTAVAYASNEDAGSSWYCNYKGPVTAVKHLPTTSQWPNVSLKTSTRAILGENQNTHNSPTASNTALPTEFSYEGKAARLASSQELLRACNISGTVSFRTGELDSCTYLLENSMYAKEGYTLDGYWTENPRATVTDTVIFIQFNLRWIYKDSASNLKGVRPVIDVPKSNIEY